MAYSLYVADCETTGLTQDNDIIEVSFLRMSDGVQKTWCLKPLNFNMIDPGALRVNGHKLEDITHQTKFGRDTYLDPAKTIVEIENWIMEDDCPAEMRCLVGQNVFFDKMMLEQLWTKCNSKDTFPFGRRIMDTMVMAFMIDYAEENLADNYSLSALIKKYGIKNDKAHSAAADVRATKELFDAQIKYLRNQLK